VLFGNLGDETKDALIWEAVCASSAAPTYFDPMSVDGCQLIDGGVGHNNPARLARDVWKRYFRADACCIVSSGCGVGASEQINAHWIKAVQTISEVNAMMSVLTTAAEVDEWMRNQPEVRPVYFRFNADGDGVGSIPLDNACPDAIKKMEDAAQQYLTKEGTMQDLNRCSNMLLACEHGLHPIGFTHNKVCGVVLHRVKNLKKPQACLALVDGWDKSQEQSICHLYTCEPKTATVSLHVVTSEGLAIAGSPCKIIQIQATMAFVILEKEPIGEQTYRVQFEIQDQYKMLVIIPHPLHVLVMGWESNEVKRLSAGYCGEFVVPHPPTGIHLIQFKTDKVVIGEVTIKW